MWSQYLQLIFFRAHTSLTAEAAKTYLSFLWWIIDPVISLCVYYFVFSVILERGVGDYVSFLLVGLVVWQWFSTSISNSTNSIENAGSLISQIRFPKAILPMTVVLVNTYKFSLILLVLLGYLLARGYTPSIEYVALVPIFSVLLVTIFATSIVVACIVPLVPDLQFIVVNLVRATMFLSAIFFPIAAIPMPYRDYLMLNPMVSIIESARVVLLENSWPNWDLLIYPSLLSVVLLVFAIWLSRKMDQRFARILAQR